MVQNGMARHNTVFEPSCCCKAWVKRGYFVMLLSATQQSSFRVGTHNNCLPELYLQHGMASFFPLLGSTRLLLLLPPS